MVERKIRWNRFTDMGEQIRLRHRYVVAVLNEPREILRIQQKFLDQMLPVDNVSELLDHSIPRSNGLHCKIFSFSSDQEVIRELRIIYANLRQFKRDRNLGEYCEERLIRYARNISSS